MEWLDSFINEISELSDELKTVVREIVWGCECDCGGDNLKPEKKPANRL